MKKIWIFLIIITLIAGVYFATIRDTNNLKSQVLTVDNQGKKNGDVSDCSKMSEDSANDCYLKFAIEKEDKTICDKISKTSKRAECRREVEIIQ